MTVRFLRLAAPWLAFAGPFLTLVSISAGAVFVFADLGAFAVVGVVAAVGAAACALVVGLRLALSDFARSWKLRLLGVAAAFAFLVGGFEGVWISAAGLVLFLIWSIAIGVVLIRRPLT